MMLLRRWSLSHCHGHGHCHCHSWLRRRTRTRLLTVQPRKPDLRVLQLCGVGVAEDEASRDANELACERIVASYRCNGHLEASLDPLGLAPKQYFPRPGKLFDQSL